MTRSRQAYVIGSGPNGLTAAIELARAGYKTTLLEARDEVGGGLRSAELTLPGFMHDMGSAVHPLAYSSPAFTDYPLKRQGLQWIQPEIPMAHVLDHGEAALLHRDIRQTARELGDEKQYQRLATAFTQTWPELIAAFLQPMLPPTRPFVMARFGFHGAQPALWEARKTFDHPKGRALFAGLAAHSALPLTSIGSAAFGWVLGIAAHAVGWPIPRGGSQQIANALASYFKELGCEIVCGERVRSLQVLRDAELIFCDTGTEELMRIAGDRLPPRYRRNLKRYRQGPAAYKLDWALSGPIPWRNADAKRAGTVHVGGTLEEVVASERAAWKGKAAERPFILLVQPSIFDSTRAPQGSHTAWAYCHVPNGSQTDQTAAMEDQVERFAPGFKETILKRHVTTPQDFEHWNPNFTGGDILGGAQTPLQLLFRPTKELYRTPVKGLYLCSAYTPPGGGVHGMCGLNAVITALRDR